MLKPSKNNYGQINLVTMRPYAKGEVLVDLSKGTMTKTRELRTIELAPDLHVDDAIGGYVQHHCDPNGFVDKQLQAVVAIRDLDAGAEVNFDYIVNESEISSSFDCRCGAGVCRGYIGTANSTRTYLEA